MSDMHDTRRLNGGGQDRKLDPERSEPNVPKAAASAPAVKPEPLAPVKAQIAEGEEDRRRLWQRLADLGSDIKLNKMDSIISVIVSTIVVCVGMLFVIWRQGANVEERLAAQRKANEVWQEAMVKQVQEFYFAFERLAADVDKGREIIVTPSTQQICDEEWMNKRTGWYTDRDTYIPRPHEFIEYDGDPILGRLHERSTILVSHCHRMGPLSGLTEWAWICLDEQTYALTKNMKTLDVRKIQEAMSAMENPESWEPFRPTTKTSARVRRCKCVLPTAEDISRAAKLAPLPLTKLRCYDGETIVGSAMTGPEGHPFPCAFYAVNVLHRSYLYSDECVRVQVPLFAEDYALLKDKKVFDVRLLEDARRNR